MSKSATEPKLLSIDTETTGLDLYHGAKPFFVTTCGSNGEILYWEWPVDPVTREPQIPESDLDEIEEVISNADKLICQNGKFDIKALGTVRPSIAQNWRWQDTCDTLIADHLLASNKPHDLTSLALRYLKVNIEPLEKKLREVVLKCRHIAKRDFPKWRIAKRDVDGMPSAKEETWKFDTWLPKALADQLNYPANHIYRTVLRDYANADSEVTMGVWLKQWEKIKQRKLEKFLEYRLKLLPVVFRAENYGVTENSESVENIYDEYKTESAKAEETCVNVAKSYGYDLTLPKSSMNGSLAEFCFGKEIVSEEGKVLGRTRWLDLPVIARTDKGNPQFDKDAIEQYTHILRPHSKQLLFVKALAYKRKRDKSNEYLDSYRKFWLPVKQWVDDSIPHNAIAEVMGGGSKQLWYRLHPSLNITGTRTTRFSCANPNAQQISKQETKCPKCDGEGCQRCDMSGEDLHSLRVVFGPVPGRVWYSGDASNIELRIPAFESGEQDLIDLFEKPDEPPYYGSEHILNFSVIWPELWTDAVRKVGLDQAGPYCKKTYKSTQYQWTKNGDFAVQYGAVDKAGGTGTADRAFHKSGAHSMLKSRFAKKERLNRKWIEFANKWGYVETCPDKTIDPTRGYPLLCTRTDYGQILPTVPLSYHVQGTAGDWMNKAMIRVDEYLMDLNKKRREDKQFHIILTVHDELLFDFPGGTEHELRTVNLPIIKEVKCLMEFGGENINIPTPVNFEFHPDNWGKGVPVV